MSTILNEAQVLTFAAQKSSGLREKISRLEAGADKKFLVLGTGLQQLYMKTDELAKETKGAVVGDGSDENVLDFVDDITTRTLKNLRGEYQISLEIYKKVKITAQALEELTKSIVAIKEIGRQLWTVGTNIAIQSRQSVQAEKMFGQYSLELKQFAKDIKNIVTDLRTDAQSLESLLFNVLYSVETETSRMNGLISSADENVKDSSSVIRQMVEESNKRTQQAGILFENIGHQVSEIVTAIQFHDITRQQLEHIVDAFEDGQKSTDPGMLHTIARLQNDQMNNVVQEVHAAHLKIESSFSGIKDELCRLQDQFEDSSDSSQSSGFKRLGTVFDHLGQMINEANDLKQSSLESLQSAFESSSQLSTHLTKVDTIASDLNLQAINAIVMSRKIGNEGASLVALAKEVHDLSKHSGGLVKDVVIKLENMVNLVAVARDFLEGKQLDSTLLEEYKTSRAQIAQSEKDFLTSNYATAEKANLLMALTNEEEGKAEFLTEMVAELNICSNDIEEVSNKTKQFSGDESLYLEKMRDDLDRYTMKSERDVHLGFEDGSVAMSALEENEQIDEMGDFELF